MKIKLLNSGGYSHREDLEFPIIIDDESAFGGSQTVRIQTKLLLEAGFTNMHHQDYAFCLVGHPFGREAVIL